MRRSVSKEATTNKQGSRDEETGLPSNYTSIPAIINAEQELWYHVVSRDGKMMKGTINVTAPLPSKGTSKVTYETHPHIIEHLMSFCSFSVLLTFRASCRRLRSRADRLFGSRVEWDQDGNLHPLFEAPGGTILKRNRIPILYSHRKEDISFCFDVQQIIANHPTRVNLDHRITSFSVAQDKSEWFTAFLEGINSLDMFGGRVLFMFPNHNANDGKNARSNVKLEPIKIPTLRLYGSGTDDVIPFTADTVEIYSSMHLPVDDVAGTWFFFPKRIPTCQEVVHCVSFNLDQHFGPPALMNTVQPFQYPISVTEVKIIFRFAYPWDFAMTGPSTHTQDHPGILSNATFLKALYRACGAFSTDIKWIFVGFRALKVYDSGHTVEPDDVPQLVLTFLGRSKALQEGKPVTKEELHRQQEEIASHVVFRD